jgi:AraC-like DNA-binding protein
MGQITSLFLHKVVRQVDAGLDRAGLLASAGVDPEAPVDPALMLEDTVYYDTLERIARVDPGADDLPLRVGATMRCEDYGAFGLAFKAALDLRGSYLRAERYARVLTSVTRYTLGDADDGMVLQLHRDGERRLGLCLSNEASIASVVAISQEVSTAPFRPRLVCFRHRAPGSTVAHERHFGCPVRFGADMDAIVVSAASLHTPNRVGDTGISQFFDAHLEEALSKLDDDASLERRVRIQISQALSQGIPRISDVAGRLGMSGRTLQRRLAERGHAFQTLVDESRRALAERLLRETTYPLAEVAFLTGFSEQSAFNRAFKRWAGRTPRSYRLEGPAHGK